MQGRPRTTWTCLALGLCLGLVGCDRLPGENAPASHAECQAAYEHLVDLALGTDAPSTNPATAMKSAMAAHRKNLLAASANDVAACEASKSRAFAVCAQQVTTLDELSDCDAADLTSKEGM